MQPVDPITSSILSKFLAPQLQNVETQAATGAEGASAYASTESGKASELQQQINQRQLLQQKFADETQSIFDKSSGSTGYVSPQTYNTQKQKAASLGINADDFDRLYEHNYTDPTSINYNTSAGFANRNAQGEIKRQIQAQIDQYNSIPQDQKGIFSKSGLPGVLGQINAPEATAYENSRAGLAGQLKGLIGGTGLRITGPELDRWQNLLPSPRNSAEQNNKNLQILDAQLKATFNTPGGLDSHYMPKANAGNMGNASASPPTPKGGDLLTNLLTNAGNDIKGIVGGQATNPLLTNILDPNAVSKSVQAGANTPRATANEYGDLLKNPIQHIMQHPVNTALDILPFLGLKGLKGEGGEPTGGSMAEAAPSIKDPNALQKIFSPEKIKANAGSIRETLVDQSSKAGHSISGDDIFTKLQNWANATGKPGNPGQGAKIDAIINDAEQQYKGKQITPAQAFNIYNEVDSGYNAKNVQKDAIQSRGDIALRQILRGELEKAAPGFDKLTNIIGQGYQAEKGAGAKIIKNLPQNAVRAGLNVAGLGVLREFLAP